MPHENNALFAVDSIERLDRWDRLQTLQVDVAFALEIPTYYMSKTWSSAQTVLDLGTGNGYYLSRLAGVFQNKSYLGVDSAGDLLGRAKERNGFANVTFKNADFFELNGNYDAVVLRAVLQHVYNQTALLDKLAQLVRPGGSVTVSDGDRRPTLFWPPAPGMQSMFDELAEQEQAAAGVTGPLVDEFEQLVKRDGRFAVELSRRLLLPSSVAANVDLLHTQLALTAELLADSRAIDIDFDALRQDWDAWHRAPGRYAQLGMHMLVLTADRGNPMRKRRRVHPRPTI